MITSVRYLLKNSYDSGVIQKLDQTLNKSRHFYSNPEVPIIDGTLSWSYESVFLSLEDETLGSLRAIT